MTKVIERILSGFSMYTILSFKCIENKRDVYKRKDCMKEFTFVYITFIYKRKDCMKEFLREDAMKMINFKKKALAEKQQELCGNVKICFICYEKV